MEICNCAILKSIFDAPINKLQNLYIMTFMMCYSVTFPYFIQN